MVFERPSSYSMERQWFSMGAYHWPNDPIVKPIVLVVKKEPITIGANCQCKGISYLRDIHWTRWNGNGFQRYPSIVSKYPSKYQTINGTKASFMSTQYSPSLAQSPRPRFIAFNYLQFPKNVNTGP